MFISGKQKQTFFLGLMLKVTLLKKSKVEQFYSTYLFIKPSKFLKPNNYIKKSKFCKHIKRYKMKVKLNTGSNNSLNCFNNIDPVL